MHRAGLLHSAAIAAAVALAPLGAAVAAAGPSANASADSSALKAPDTSGYQQLLNELLTVISAKGAPLDTRFDYEKLHDMRGRFERC
jgi:hypothetical protein